MKNHIVTRIGKVTASAMLVSSLVLPLGTTTIHNVEAASANVKVQILSVNDFHGQLDKSSKVGNDTVGTAAYLAAHLKKHEAANPNNTIKIHAGDAVGASRPVSALLQDEPTIEMFNKLKFDIGTLGNHEFDEGVEEMKRLINGGEHANTKHHGSFEGAQFPYISANVVDSKTKQPILDPYIIKESGGEKIGFIGITLAGTPSIVTPSGVAGVDFTDEVTAINKYTTELKEQGIKAIVVIAHNPGTSNTDGTNPDGEAINFANTVDDEVDVIFAAHNHRYLNATVDNKLLVQAYSSGTALADVDLEIDPATHDIVKKEAVIANTTWAGIEPDQEIDALVKKYKEETDKITEEIVGEAAVNLTKDQNEDGESILGNVIADSMRAEMKTDFGFMNPGGIRASIDKGPINWGNVFTVEPFGNDLVSLNITGEQVRTLLNQQWTETKTNILQLSGLNYTWSAELPIGKRVLDITLPNGDKIDPAKTYSATVNNFMAEGGDNYTILRDGTNKVTGPVDFDALLTYVKANSPLKGSIEGRIKKVTKTTIEPAIVNPISDKDSVIEGKTESGAAIVAAVNNKEIGKATADAAGLFKIQIKPQAAGTVITVTATDSAQRSSETTLTVTDLTAPAAPTVHAVSDAAKMVTGKAEANSTVSVKIGKKAYTAKADTKGNFSITIPSQKAATRLDISAVDAAGNVSKVVKVTVIDKTAPATPSQLKATPGTVTGKTEARSTVYVKAGSKLVGKATASKSGTFKVKIKKQKVGKNLSVYSVDKAGNKSVAKKITIKTAAPAVTKVKANAKKVTGKAEVNSTVYVKAGNKTLGHAKASKNGKFTVVIKKQKAGTALTVYSKDKKGSTSYSTTLIVSK
ncbi:Ig-like domain-containing protein [Peribacillus sp. FSL H8-0477]|uniref:Ig-like domain-containing protein n=2 Tax=Peribacillus sp. FSL H8-0477 TaxID=2921388 RepID=UPI0030F71244